MLKPQERKNNNKPKKLFYSHSKLQKVEQNSSSSQYADTIFAICDVLQLYN